MSIIVDIGSRLQNAFIRNQCIRKSHAPESNGAVRNPLFLGIVHWTKLKFTRLWLPSKGKGVDNCGKRSTPISFIKVLFSRGGKFCEKDRSAKNEKITITWKFPRLQYIWLEYCWLWVWSINETNLATYLNLETGQISFISKKLKYHLMNKRQFLWHTWSYAPHRDHSVCLWVCLSICPALLLLMPHELNGTQVVDGFQVSNDNTVGPLVVKWCLNVNIWDTSPF